MGDAVRWKMVDDAGQMPEVLRSAAAMGEMLRMTVAPKEARELAHLLDLGRSIEAERDALAARRDAINQGWRANQLVLDRARDLQERGLFTLIAGIVMAMAGFAALLCGLMPPR